eukprot:m.19579 g.19579  ORF g.19579 m.19579 type:complete len:82 (+) comp11885_c0_seq1:233-478(+)
MPFRCCMSQFRRHYFSTPSPVDVVPEVFFCVRCFGGDSMNFKPTALYSELSGAPNTLCECVCAGVYVRVRVCMGTIVLLST